MLNNRVVTASRHTDRQTDIHSDRQSYFIIPVQKMIYMVILTFCVNLLRFALSSYVLGNVTFCGPTGCNLMRAL